MQYFDSTLSEQTFVVIGSRLNAEIDGAQPRLHAIAEARAGKPRSAGQWSRQEILGHLIDSAANNHQRFVRAQAVPELRIHGYAQEHWVASQHYAERRWRDLIVFWSAYNHHLAHVIANISESFREIPCEIGDSPVVTLSYVALDYVGHVTHHLNQIFDDW
jgi:hypothetical protein